VTHFPECDIEPAFDLADELLSKGERYLGLSIISSDQMYGCLQSNRQFIFSLLEEFSGLVLVPIVSTIHRESEAEDDLAGVQSFIEQFLPHSRIASRYLLDRQYWRRNMTPRRLKGLIARLSTLITQRKHNAIHAIGAGVRVIGLHPAADKSLVRTFGSLLSRMPPRSRCIGLN
jgi:hypothetical protein